jgi:hypothetical protein
MEIRAISMGKLTLLLSIICAGILASSIKAEAIGYSLPQVGTTSLAVGGQYQLGQVHQPNPEGDAAISQYVNFMIGLSLGGSGHIIMGPHDILVTRSMNNFGTLASATLARRGTNETVALDSQGTYAYLFAHYGGPGGGFAEVWHVANLSGNISIPAKAFGHGLSGWALFTTPTGVPDGGATVMMFGAALGLLGVMRRFLNSSN